MATSPAGVEAMRGAEEINDKRDRADSLTEKIHYGEIMGPVPLPVGNFHG